MRKHIRNTSQALALVLLFASSAASAVAWVGGGVEYFTWGEYIDVAATSGTATEDWVQAQGFMPFVEANLDFPLTERTRVALAGRAYGGSVEYSNHLAPFDSTEDRKGVRGEVGFTFMPLPQGEHKEVAFVAMVGEEVFNRKLNHSTYDREEDWQIPFIRLGAQLEAPDTGGWGARGGLIHPFAVKVERKGNIDFPGTLATSVNPEPVPSFYFGVGRRFGRFLEVGFNYEGYRFSQEASVARTETDTYQIYVKAGF